MTERYYLVERDSETHNKIEEGFKTRERGIKARWKFIHREFPDSKKRGAKYRLGFGWGPRDWSVFLPAGAEVPPDWKRMKKDKTCIQPRCTKRGRELTKEMRGDEYFVPTASAIGKDIGSPSAISGLALSSIGIQATNDGRYILVLGDAHKIPKHVERISDLEVEKLTAKKPTKKPAARRRKTTTSKG